MLIKMPSSREGKPCCSALPDREDMPAETQKSPAAEMSFGDVRYLPSPVATCTAAY